MTALALKKIPKNACSEAQEWVKESKGTPAVLWKKCKRADWMLWLVARIGVDRKLLVLAACDCAETAPRHKETPAAVECVRVCRAWCEDKATIEEVRAARRAAAYAYAYAAAAAAAAFASAAAYAAAFASDDAARSKALEKMADLVSARIPWKMIAGLLP